MKNLINKTTSILSGVVLFAFGCVMAGLGFAVVGVLALFALAAIGIAILTAPFVAMSRHTNDEMNETAHATAVA
ncbi:hypothetical protein QTO30_10510 [Yoonia sp. GPGPB17]|uniref:hypothetical protein n=1 Tax=Yoonia sp. GPGPB17 TaxID=3026147 RepID=UPI0030C4ECE3